MKRQIALSLIIVGLSAVSIQIILLREFLITMYGNELSIGIFICTWLIGSSIGARVGYNIKACEARIKKHLILSHIILPILFLTAFIFIRLWKVIFGINLGEIVSVPVIILLSLLACMPVSLLLGYMFIICSILINTDRTYRGVGLAYFFETIGSFLGGIITGVVLINFVSNIGMASIIAAVNMFVVFVLFWYFAKKRPVIIYVPSICLAIILCVTASYNAPTIGGILDDIKFKPFSVVSCRDSKYGNIALLKMGSQYSFYVNGLHLSSVPDAFTAEEIAHIPMLLHKDPKDVLLIGGAVSEVPNEILKHDISSLVCVELDPELVKIAEKNFRKMPWYKINDKRITLILQDARLFVKKSGKKYDVVIMSLPAPHTAQINRLYTQEFFEEISLSMNEGAVFYFGVPSSENYISDTNARFLRTIHRTLNSVFGDVRIMPGDTLYFVSSLDDGPLDISAETIERKRADRGIDTSFVRGYYLSSKLSKERIEYAEDIIRGQKDMEDKGHINTDLFPIAYYYDMVLWSAYFSKQTEAAFKLLERIGVERILLFIILILLISWVYLHRKKDSRYSACVLAVGTTGASEISFQIVTIIVFQILYGYVFEKIGLIIACFMIGLSAGSFLATRRLESITKPYTTIIKLQFLVLAYPIFQYMMIRYLKGMAFMAGGFILWQNLFAGLPVIAGFIGGFQFVVALRCSSAFGKTSTQGASVMYSTDLLGACIGGMLISTLLIPVMGIYRTLSMIVFVNAITLLLLVHGKKRRGGQ